MAVPIEGLRFKMVKEWVRKVANPNFFKFIDNIKNVKFQPKLKFSEWIQ